MNEQSVQLKLKAFCTICDKVCIEEEQLAYDQVLFEQCLMIMRDDLAAAIEYLRLNSSLDQVICTVRNFIQYVITEGIQFKWYDKNTKKLVEIPPPVFTRCIKQALKRWRYELPEQQVFDDMEEILAAGVKGQLITENDLKNGKERLLVKHENPELGKRVEKQNFARKPEPIPVQLFIPRQTADDSSFQPAVNLVREIETECPACGGTLAVPFDENELETLLTGGRMMKKAVEHVNGSDSHVVELHIDSQLRIRRSAAIKLVRAVM